MPMPVLIVLIALLFIHYLLAIFTIYILMRDMGLVKAMIPWNLFILLFPIIGPCTYLVYRKFTKKK